MNFPYRSLRNTCLTAMLVSLALLTGCSNSSSSTTAPDAISLYLTSSFVGVPADGSQADSIATVSRSAGNSNAVTLSVSGVPTGLTATITQPGTGSFGTIFLSTTSATTAGVYPVTVTANDGTATATATLSVTTFSLTITPTTTSLLVRQDGTAAALPFTIGRSTGNMNNVTVASSGLPTGLTATFTQPATGTAGSVSFAASTTPPTAGVYTVTLTATDSKAATATTTVSITVGVVLTVANAVDTTIGVNSGHLQQFMSTGFQPSTYNNSYFTNFPSTTDLSALNSHHLRLQPVVGALPWATNSSPQASTDWSFSALDQTVQPVLTVDDNSPIFQIAKAPAFMDDANGHFIFNSTNLTLLTTYATNLVRYYNTNAGFTWGGKTFVSPGTHHITWWAIFNEPNLNNITAAQYVQMYNTLVPAMLAVDPTLKFVGLELSDYSQQPQAYMPTLVLPTTSGGINAPLNALATHFYGTCMQTSTDSALFTGVTQFATDVKYITAELALRSDLAGTPIWVTENNVNSDYGLPTGYSNCTPTQLYVLDPRGTSTFFTAYRPLIFSLLGKAGNGSLYHFLYEGSASYGEVNSGSNAKTIAYWTDYWLQRTFPWDGVSTGSLLYKTTTSEKTATVDVIAVRNADNSVSVMVTNYAVAATTDDNGTGVARTVLLDTTALGTFSSGTEVDLNASTALTTGPTAKAITPTAVMTLSFTGYGTSMFTLKP